MMNSTISNSSAATNDSVASRTDSGIPSPYFWPFVTLDFIGTVLNSVFLATFIKVKNIRLVPFNWLLLNVCVSDLIFTTLDAPFFMVLFFAAEPPTNKTLCHVYETISWTNSAVTQPAIALLSVDRLAAVYFPVQYRQRRTVKNTIASAACIWCLSIFVVWPALVVDWTMMSTGPVATICIPDLVQLAAWYEVDLVFAYFLPMAIIVITPIPLLVKLRSARRTRTTARRTPAGPTEAVGTGAPSRRNEANQERNSNVILAMSSVASLCFLLPCDVFLQLGYVEIGTVLFMINSCANPLVYQHTNESVRHALRRIFFGALTAKSIAVRAPLRETDAITPQLPSPQQIQAGRVTQGDVREGGNNPAQDDNVMQP